MKEFNIKKVSITLDKEIKSKIDLKTKPVGALGELEEIALKIARIQQTLAPILEKPTIAVFAGDHGIAKKGLVNPYPQEVTYQMVMNFLSGGAAINVLAKQNDIAVKVIDAGVNHDFGETEGLINTKIDLGTANYLDGKAMTIQQCESALVKGAQVIENIHKEGSNVIGFGEMGIGNTSSASLLMSVICQIPIEECVGKGTGVNRKQFDLKVKTLQQVREKHDTTDQKDALEILTTFGGFEIAQMCGGMLKAAELGMLILVDGFISGAAMLVAQMIDKNVLEYGVFTHHSNEEGHSRMLDFLKANPLINIGLRLGEGTGCAISYPIIQSACAFLNDMASFEDASVSQKS